MMDDGSLQSVLAFGGTGLTLGLVGGLAPGPLTTLVVTQSLRFGGREGAKVAFAPLLTDGPMVLASAFLLHRLASVDLFLGGIALVGAAFLLWLAWDAASASGIPLTNPDVAEAASVRKSVLTNLLNPHPYLFWLTVGGPLTVEAFAASGGSCAAFLAGFFVALVGAKVVIATMVGRYRSRLGGVGYRWVMRALALAMVGFAVLFTQEGLRLLAG